MAANNAAAMQSALEFSLWVGDLTPEVRQDEFEVRLCFCAVRCSPVAELLPMQVQRQVGQEFAGYCRSLPAHSCCSCAGHDRAGQVRDRRLLDSLTLRHCSKGFGFVRFETEAEMMRCMMEMNGAMGLGQRPLRVSSASARKYGMHVACTPAHTCFVAVVCRRSFSQSDLTCDADTLTMTAGSGTSHGSFAVYAAQVAHYTQYAQYQRV